MRITEFTQADGFGETEFRPDWNKEPAAEWLANAGFEAAPSLVVGEENGVELSLHLSVDWTRARPGRYYGIAFWSDGLAGEEILLPTIGDWLALRCAFAPVLALQQLELLASNAASATTQPAKRRAKQSEAKAEGGRRS